jgi:hypothetical protein
MFQTAFLPPQRPLIVAEQDVQTAERAVPPRGLWKTGKVVCLYLFVFKWLF